MIHLTTYTQILLATDPADFRMGIDGLAARCRGHWQPIRAQVSCLCSSIAAKPWYTL
jgi:hypothetical protein